VNDQQFFKSSDPITDSANSSALVLGDDSLIAVQASWTVTTPSAKTFSAGTAEVQTLTFPAKADATDGDYVVVETSQGTQYAAALSKNVVSVQLLTFLAKASCVAGDFLLLYDPSGLAWGISVNKSGTDAQPTAKGWTDIPAGRKAHVDISSATTAAEVAALFETAMDALTDFPWVTDDSAADGTMLLTASDPGAVTLGAPFKATAGTGVSGSPVGTSIVAAMSVEGSVTAEPTGAIWSAISASNKASVDIDAATDAASVAALVETALNALTGFTAAITSDDTADDGTMTLTQVEPGAVDDPVVKNADDSGAGSISGEETTPGVGGVDLGRDAMYSEAHGMETGLKVRVSTSGALPTGLAALTDYFVIKVSANELKLASSLANAQASTAINLTARGSGTQTITPQALSASTKLQKTVNGTWVDLHDDEILGGSNSQTISASGSVFWIVPYASWKQLRQSVTLTGGQLTMSSSASSKRSLPRALDTVYNLQDATSVEWDASNGPTYSLVLGGNRTIQAPTNQVAGQMYVLFLHQDATGNRTVNWDEAGFKFAGGIPPTITATASGMCMLKFISDGTYFVFDSITLALDAQPNAPSNLVATTDEVGQVTLTWDDNSSIETAYRVERFNGLTWDVLGVEDEPANTEMYVDTVDPGTYQYRVKAIKGSVASNPSNTAEGESL
jgi:hypothetical protein